VKQLKNEHKESVSMRIDEALLALPVILRGEVRLYWENFIDAIAAQSQAGEQHDIIATFDAALYNELAHVWAGSEFVAQRCTARPALLFELLESGDLYRAYGACNEAGAGEMSQHAGDFLQSVFDPDSLAVQLRRLRQREMLRIAWRDITQLACLEETMADLSALAEACVQGALTYLQAALEQRLGEPRNAQGVKQGLLVLGMGKLGAGELNFSSDVDLIFAYGEDGETTKGKVNSVFFKQLGQQLIRSLDETTADGFVFRVDMRLRPFGESGALASSFSTLENYYQTHGRDWERYALIKARVVAGNVTEGERLFEILRPFVFRRYLDYGAFEALRSMKKKVESEFQRRGMSHNVKLGRGGIREVEFIAQAFQLIRGGREPALQQRELQRVLHWLSAHDYLPEYVVQQLLTAYVFLRNTEHRLQEFQDRQTHQLPSKPLAQQRLAFSMGFEQWDDFLPVLRGHMARVHSHFEQVFVSPQLEHSVTDPSRLRHLWLAELAESEGKSILQGAGFADGAVLFSRLQALKKGRCYAALSRTGRNRMDNLMPLLLSATSKLKWPFRGEAGTVTTLDLSELRHATLLRILHLLEVIARRTAYLSMLAEHPMALSQLVRLCAGSPWVTQMLVKQPILLDELFDARILYTPPTRAQLEADVLYRLQRCDADDLEQKMDALRHFKQASVLRVAAADLVAETPLMAVSNYLTDIAEVVLLAALDLAWDYLVKRHGLPAGLESHEHKGFAIIAYGKLGGLELGYGSDLDLVFLYGTKNQSLESSAETALTAGPRAINNSMFYIRLGQRIIHILTTLTPAGVLYETDMRLRPSGASGLLVTALSSYRAYQQKKAWTWEHQALVRARCIGGDEHLGQAFRALRHEVLTRRREPQRLRDDVVEMRERMRETLVHAKEMKKDQQFDLKQGRGGIADIEFMVQFGVLNWAHKTPALTQYTDNVRLLDSLAQQSLQSAFLTAQDAEVLADIYRRYRAEVHRLVLQDKKALIVDSLFVTERDQVVALWLRLFECGEQCH
jgi:[glutamine synthetase] adenylyltransferase / [glutamine synthetase]-adenylyl-L-tyrosine phosphorylase